MKKEIIMVVLVVIFALSFSSISYAAELDNEQKKTKETIYVNVDQLFNGARSSYMQIEGSGLDFNNTWEKHYYLYCSSNSAIVGEMTYGYDKSTTKVYCKTYSYLYTHAAQIQIDSNFYQSSNVLKCRWAQKSISHYSSHNSKMHVFGIELVNPESGVSYYLEVVE